MGVGIQESWRNPLASGIDHAVCLIMGNGVSGDLRNTTIFDRQITNGRLRAGAVKVAAAFDEKVVRSHCVISFWGSCYCRNPNPLSIAEANRNIPAKEILTIFTMNWRVKLMADARYVV